MVAADPLRAMVNEGNAANGSFGEGEAIADLRIRALGTGLSKDCLGLVSAHSFLGRPGDQSVPSFLPNRIGGVWIGDVIASRRPADGDSMSFGCKETDSQNAWLRRVLSAGDTSPPRLSGGGRVMVKRGDS